MDLFSPGCLGTCWYGDYHYMEPWVGCEHDCFCCYARFRTEVKDCLTEKAAAFEKPVLMLEPDLLLAEIHEKAVSGEVKTLKLSRFTDLFTPKFVREGLSQEILKILARSKVERIIITTKGLPGEETLDLMARHPALFSYNVAAKPQGKLSVEPNLFPLEERLKAAAFVKKAGVLTTVHLDPVLVGIEDEKVSLDRFFAQLTRHGLDRVMFSYLLLNPLILEHMEKKLGQERMSSLTESYEGSPSLQYLPQQAETVSIPPRASLKEESVERISHMLRERRFDFVLCSLKSAKDGHKVDRQLCPLCDGRFYA